MGKNAVEIVINMDNAAFEENGKYQELARILRELAEKIETRNGLPANKLYDYNGNACGYCTNWKTK